jgi:4-amino-4-deoxy-L-arabinose transferase-like glycosyltransferase
MNLTIKELFQSARSIIMAEFALLSKPQGVEFSPSLLLVPLFLSLILRLSFLIWPEVIYNDSTVYIAAAKGILEGRWVETIVPPLYPALMVMVNFLTNDLELAGILVSFVFGSFLFVPVFYLAKELYDARTGMIAALLATVLPCFVKYSGAVLTESIYYFLVAAIVLTALKAQKTGRLRWTALFGVATAMGYLTKPEAVGFLIVFVTWALLFPPITGPRPVLRRIVVAIVAILCFAALSSPYMLLLRKELGHWELSKKVSVSVGSEDAEATDFAVERASISRRVSFSSWVKHPISFAKVAISGVFISFYKFQVALNPLLFLLAVWGFTRRREGNYPWNQNLFLIAFIFFFFAFVFPHFKMSARYSSQMIPTALPWTAYGFVHISDWFTRFEATRRRALGIGLLIVMTGLIVQGSLEGDREHRELQREVGLWLKHNGVHGEKIMSPRVHEAFYAEMELVRYQEDDLGTVIEAVDSKRAHYVVIHQQMEKSHPDFKTQLERYGLVSLREWKQGKDKIWVFENAGRASTSAKEHGR